MLISVVLLPALAVVSFLRAQQPQESPLEKVLHTLDTAAANFQTAQADFVWDQYEKVVGETDTQKGTVYYRRSGKDIEMMAEIKDPDHKFVLYKDGKLQMYQPKIDQVTNFATGNNRAEVESYLVLGFGASGQDLTKAYDITYQGEEKIDNILTAKIQLIPKSDKVRNYFPKILLWIDLSRGISIQQQLIQTQGDFRTARYSDVRLKEKIPGDVFRLKTTGKTQFVSPRG